MEKRVSIQSRLPYVPLLIALLLCAACAAVRPTQQAEREFFREHSKKMGVNFRGTEDREVIKTSAEWMGTPYRYGGQTKKGVDCSGFVCSVYKEAHDIKLERSSSAMAKQVQRVKKSELACGDLVFFTIKDKRVSHVGIYMGGNKFIHASTNYGVSMASLTDSYWSKYFSGAGRILAPSEQEPASADAVADMALPAGKVEPSKKDAVPAAKKKKSDPQQAAQTSSADDVIIVFDEEF